MVSGQWVTGLRGTVYTPVRSDRGICARRCQFVVYSVLRAGLSGIFSLAVLFCAVGHLESVSVLFRLVDLSDASTYLYAVSDAYAVHDGWWDVDAVPVLFCGG